MWTKDSNYSRYEFYKTILGEWIIICYMEKRLVFMRYIIFALPFVHEYNTRAYCTIWITNFMLYTNLMEYFKTMKTMSTFQSKGGMLCNIDEQHNNKKKLKITEWVQNTIWDTKQFLKRQICWTLFGHQSAPFPHLLVRTWSERQFRPCPDTYKVVAKEDNSSLCLDTSPDPRPCRPMSGHSRVLLELHNLCTKGRNIWDAKQLQQIKVNEKLTYISVCLT